MLIKSNAFIDKLVGDQVVGLFVPGFAGPQFPSVAIDAAKKLLQTLGHGDPHGPWIPVGVGIHTGTAFMDAVGAKGSKIEITALGDAVNVGAHLASEAKQGEALISEATVEAAGMDLSELERRDLKLKGRSEPVKVRVLRAD